MYACTFRVEFINEYTPMALKPPDNKGKHTGDTRNPSSMTGQVNGIMFIIIGYFPCTVNVTKILCGNRIEWFPSPVDM